MSGFFTHLYDSLVDLSPDDLIGAIAIGLALSMACSGLCLLAQKKAACPFSPVCGVVFAVVAASLAIGLGHGRQKYAGPRPDGPTLHQPDPRLVGQGMSRRPGRHWLQEADVDHDGHLTPEEAARFVREADTAGKGWIDPAEFDRARREHHFPPVVGKPPESATPGPGLGDS